MPSMTRDGNLGFHAGTRDPREGPQGLVRASTRPQMGLSWVGLGGWVGEVLGDGDGGGGGLRVLILCNKSWRPKQKIVMFEKLPNIVCRTRKQQPTVFIKMKAIVRCLSMRQHGQL